MADSAVVGLLRVLLTANSAELETAFKRSQDSAKVWSKELKTIGQQASDLGAALTKTLTIPIIGFGAGAIKAASDFDSSFAGVRKTVDGVVDDAGQLTQVGQQISDGLREMAKEIPVSVNELAKVAEAAGQLGIKKEDILQFTETMAALGVTTNLTAEEAATATAQIQNIFGAAGKDVDRFGATLVALGNAGASTEKDIINMGLRIAGAGKQVGLSQDQVLSFASALSSVGINAEAGGSAISRVFLKINDAVASGGPELVEFARVAGMSAEDFKTAFEKDAASATVSFISGLKRVKGEGENVNATLEGLVGKNIIVKDTLLRASGAGDMLADTLKLGARAWEENSALTKEAEQRYRTFESQVTVLWNQIRDLGIEVGTALLPAFRDLLGAVRPVIQAGAELAKWFGDLPEPVRTAGVAIFGLVAVAGPATFALGELAGAASTLIGAFKAGGILAGVPALIRGIGVAAAAAAPQLLVFVAAAGGVIAIGQAVRLVTERLEQNSLAIEQNKSHAILLATASKIAGREITDLAEAEKIAAAETARLRAESQKQIDALGEQTRRTTGAKAAVAGFSDELEQTRKEVAALSDEQKKAISAGLALGKSHKDIAEAVGESEAAVELFVKGLKAQDDQAKRSAAANKKAAEDQKEFAASVRDYYNWVGERQLEDAAAAIKATEEKAKAEREYFNEIGQRRMENEAAAMAAIEEEQKKRREYFNWLGERRMQADADAMASNKKQLDGLKTFADGISGLGRAFSQLAQVSGGAFGGIAKAIGNVVASLDVGVQAGMTFIQGFNQALKGGAKNLVSGIASLATGLVSGIGSIMGATSTGTALERAIGGAITGAGVGATIGAGIGAAIASSASTGATVGGAWGLAAGAIVGIFIGVFRGRDTRREMERVGEEWGVAISEGVANKIKDNARNMFEGNRQAARIFNLSEILNESGGLDPSNLNEFTARLRDVFVMFQTGAFDAAEAMHVLEENWAEFARVGTDSSGRLSTGLREILFLARENGLMTQAMTDYTRQQSRAAIEGFGGIIAASSRAREGYARLADNVRIAQAEVDRLKSAGITSGVEMTRAQENLTGALREQQGAAAAAQGELTDMATIAVGVYAAAIANGMSHTEAIESAGPAILEVTKAYQDLGIDVDNAAFKALSMQAKLQQSNPQLISGVNSLSKSFIALSNTNTLNESSFRAMERTGFQMYTRLQGEVARLGGSSADALLPMQDYLHEAEKQAKLLGIPLDANTQMLIDQSKELGIWKKTGEDSADDVKDAMNELVKAVQDLIQELRTIPPRITTTVTTRYEEEGERPPHVPDGAVFTPPESFARGSDGLRDFGTGTLAMLHGREGVYTEAQIEALQRQGPEVTVNTGSSERVLQEMMRLVRKLPRDLKVAMKEVVVMA